MTTAIESPAGALTAEGLDRAFDLFDESAARFLTTRKSPVTKKSYKVHLQRFRSLCERSSVSPMGADALITFNRLVNDHATFKNDTKRAYLKTIQKFFSWCYAFGLIQLNPKVISEEIFTMPEARRLSPRDLLSEDEAQRLLAAARFWPADHCLITLMLGAGLRLSEVLALKAGDVYQAGGRCFVRVERGKGGKSREVPITPATFETVNVYIGNFDNIQVSIFPDYYPRRVQRVITRQARRAAIDKPITPHSLRHTYANKLAELGTPIELIGELLGHASLDTTKTYTRPGELLRRADLPALPW